MTLNKAARSFREGAGHQHMSVDASSATAAAGIDPSRTRILGNFQYRYWFKNVDISSATWARKHLGGAHARMELDPRVWAQVERLIRRAIPQ